MVEDAIAGRVEAEAESELESLKQELDEALEAIVAANNKLNQKDVLLQERNQQLASVRQEEQQKIQNAISKTSLNFERLHKILEAKLRDTNKSVDKLTIDNSHLSKALQDNENLIKDMKDNKSKSEADLKAIMGKLDFMENENIYLKHEYCMLEKEIEIRNEEREFNRGYVDELLKQQVDSVNKITKLESECKRLRSIARKQGGGRSNNTTIDISPENQSKKIGFLIDRLSSVEEENKILKEIISEKNNEIHVMRIMHDQTLLKLAQTQVQIQEKSMELARLSPKSNEPSLVTRFEDGISCSGSLVKTPQKLKKLGVAEMCLMDDFVEMEKLAIFSVKEDFESSIQLTTANTEVLVKQLEEPEQNIECVKTGLEMVKVSNGNIEDQIENQNSITKDLEAKLNKVLEKLSSLEVQFEDKCRSCEELEATCLDLQLQPESDTKNIPQDNTAQEDKQMQTVWEIKTASMKLAECQETVLTIGKQLNSLASQRDSAMLDKAPSTTSTMITTGNNNNISKRSSLYNQMLADDNAKSEKLRTAEELAIVAYKKGPTVLTCNNCSGAVPLVKVNPQQPYIGKKISGGAMDIVAHKKQQKGGGGGFLRKLLIKRKRVSSKKTSLTFGIV